MSKRIHKCKRLLLLKRDKLILSKVSSSQVKQKYTPKTKKQLHKLVNFNLMKNFVNQNRCLNKNNQMKN